MSEPSPQDALAAAGLTLTEALRTVGLGLEAHGVLAAQVMVAASGIAVATQTANGRHDYPWNLIAIHSGSYQESRGAPGPTR